MSGRNPDSSTSPIQQLTGINGYMEATSARASLVMSCNNRQLVRMLKLHSIFSAKNCDY